MATGFQGDAFQDGAFQGDAFQDAVNVSDDYVGSTSGYIFAVGRERRKGSERGEV